MSKLIRINVILSLIVCIYADESFLMAYKDKNQDIKPQSEVEKIAEFYDENVNLKIERLERRIQMLEGLNSKLLSEVLKSTENINAYFKLLRQTQINMSTDLSELKTTFEHLHIRNELFKKDMLQLMDETSYKFSSKLSEQEREFELLLSEKFIPKKDMMQLMDASISNQTSKLAEQKRELELLLSEKFIPKKDMLRLMDDSISNHSSKFAEQKLEFELLIDKKLSSKEIKQLGARDYDKNLNCLKKCNATDELPKNCAEQKEKHFIKDDIHALFIPKSNLKPFYAFCAFENFQGKIWTIIQRREDGSQNFNRNWADYKRGFGDAYGEYWLGLERLHWMTKDQPHELWIFLVDYKNEKRYAKYSNFSVATENEGYKLTVNGYSGNAGDSFEFHNNKKFSTYDQDNKLGCAKGFVSGWWFENCYRCNLNGGFRYIYNYQVEYGGIKWDDWHNRSLKYTHMAIRPV